MIPVSLKLENFLSYGEDLPPLDFTGFHLACLTGPNGHGKSSLLDAVTWALWGQARKVAGTNQSSDVFLLRLGQSKMWVELVFDLTEERFKVYREFSKSGKSQRSILELFVLNPQSGEYQAITENNKKKTQERLTKLLGLDYETFINSAFLVQGKADEFTRQTPQKRKEVLSEILNLSFYEKLTVLARNKAKEAADKIEILRPQYVFTFAEEKFLAGWPALQKKLKEEKAKIDTVLDGKEKTMETLRTALSQFALQEQELRNIDIRLPKLAQESTLLVKEKNRLEKDLAAAETLISQTEAINQRVSQLQSLQAKINKWEEERKHIEELKEKRHRVEIAINEKIALKEKEKEAVESQLALSRERSDANASLLTEKDAIRQAYQEYEAAGGEESRLADLKKQAEAWQKEINVLKQTAELERQKLLSRRHSLEEETLRLKKEIWPDDELKRQKEILVEKQRAGQIKSQSLKEEMEKERLLRAEIESLNLQKKQREENLNETAAKIDQLKLTVTPACPLCESELLPQRKNALIDKLARETAVLSEELKRLKQKLQAGSQELTQAKKGIPILEKELIVLQKETDKLLLVVSHQEEKQKEQGARLAQIDAALIQIKESLEKGDYLSAINEKMASLEKQLTALAYDQKRHLELQSYLKKGTAIASRRQLLEKALAENELWQLKIKELTTTQNQLQKEIKSQQFVSIEKKEIEALAKEMASLSFSYEAYADMKKQLSALSDAALQKARLEEADKEKPRLVNQLAALVNNAAEKDAESAALKARRETLIQILARKPAEKTIAQLSAEQLAERLKREEIIAEEARNRQEFEILCRKENERQKVRETIVVLQEEKRLYEKLSVSLGKNGLQALIIENALPELELTANDILGRLTQNRTKLAFASQKDLKSGERRETLEIIISDELGPRNYEMFSGGEAFRINFALRIAIAKLLANRAGAAMKLLIIDEGFGTQDTEGIGYLINAINQISADFEKLIVVTHLEELQQAFPVRIEVYKDAETGSHFRIAGV